MAFREDHQPCNNLWCISISSVITSEEETDVIYIGFHKTFESEPYNDLLVKLWSMSTYMWHFMEMVCLLFEQQTPVCFCEQ